MVHSLTRPSTSHCPLARASRLIGDLWTLLIVKELLAGPRRFSELEKAINNTGESTKMSSRTLTIRLKKLEQEQIATRTVYKTAPPHCEYSLTAKGQQLSTIIEHIRRFGDEVL